MTSPTRWQISSISFFAQNPITPPPTCVITPSKNTSRNYCRISCRCRNARDPIGSKSRLFPSKQSCTFLELYIGGRGAIFPRLHYDGWHAHAFLMQLYGVKQYLFFPPQQTHLLYPGKARTSSLLDDVEHPDLTRFPLFAQATPIRCELHPGETLFVPGGWWHTARILSPSITVSANTANRVNWQQVVPDYCASMGSGKSRLYTHALRLHLKLLGLFAPVLDWIC